MGNENTTVIADTEDAKKISDKSTLSGLQCINTNPNVIHEGYLWVYGGYTGYSKYLRRVVLKKQLNSIYLTTYISNKNDSEKKELTIDLSEFKCKDISTNVSQKKFSIETGGSTYDFFANSEKLLNVWFDRIKFSSCPCTLCTTFACDDDSTTSDGETESDHKKTENIDTIPVYFNDYKLIGEYDLNEIDFNSNEFINAIFDTCVFEYTKKDINNSIKNKKYQINYGLNPNNYEILYEINSDNKVYGLMHNIKLKNIYKKVNNIKCLRITERNYYKVSNKIKLESNEFIAKMSDRLINKFNFNEFIMLQDINKQYCNTNHNKIIVPDNIYYQQYKGNYYELLKSEVVSNKYDCDLDVLDDELKVKMNCNTHIKYGKCLNPGELYSLILYVNTDLGIHMMKCHLKNDYNKWKWFNYCLSNGINKLSFWENDDYSIYSCFKKFNIKHVNGNVFYGYFKSYVSCALNQLTNKNIFKFNKSDFICCDVSWISKYKSEGEIVISFIDNNPLWRAKYNNNVINVEKYNDITYDDTDMKEDVNSDDNSDIGFPDEYNDTSDD